MTKTPKIIATVRDPYPEDMASSEAYYEFRDDNTYTYVHLHRGTWRREADMQWKLEECEGRICLFFRYERAHNVFIRWDVSRGEEDDELYPHNEQECIRAIECGLIESMLEDKDGPTSL